VSEAIGLARVSVKGGFNLFYGLIISTIISSLYIIFLARLLSPSDMGILAIAVVAPNLFALLRDWGINSAMTRFIAKYKSENKMANVKGILSAGVLFELTLGLSLSLLSFILSDFMATNLLQRPEIAPLIQIASFNILAEALLTATRSIFTGYERMELHSITLILQSALKAVLSLLLVIFGLGVFGAVIGNTIAALTSGLVSTSMLYIVIYKNTEKLSHEKSAIVENIKTMFKYGLPLSISAILNGLVTQFQNFLIAIYVINQLIGNYSVALNFAVLITFFATPITTVLFPAFSKLNAQKEKETLGNIFQFSVKYAALLVVPATALVIVLAQPAVFTLFGENYAEAPLYISLYAMIYLFSAFGSLSVGALINSQGKTKVNLKITIVTLATAIPLSIILIPTYGITGLIITTLVSRFPSTIISLWWIKKNLAAKIDLSSSARILLASTLAATITYITTSQLTQPPWIILITGTLIFLATYTVAAPLTGAINKTDTQNLKETLEGFGPLSYIIKIPLNLIERLIIIFQKS